MRSIFARGRCGSSRTPDEEARRSRRGRAPAMCIDRDARPGAAAAKRWTAVVVERAPAPSSACSAASTVLSHGARGQVQDAHVLDVGAIAARSRERVVGAPKRRATGTTPRGTDSARRRRACAPATRSRAGSRCGASLSPRRRGIVSTSCASIDHLDDVGVLPNLDEL